MFLTHLRAFPAANQMPRHGKDWKFKCTVSQNKEPEPKICLYKGFKVL